ncbi:hypothetical protein L226DRAFT_235724 [Lentinus tigrinus ALCF2SS1-7]|uniref:Fungal N-terminal domain-containing protein n=1 Tax=Lentinus tigrinus ALCF2SS1-6 TaxID=1328759 RepID=A0A5C2SPC6_9APHY|nr:hypothetical protein L227DRAFT_218731 [Lentinus tigrinus ALCF2SS1-6]RPD78912.1 hypothetical protein L226DRAFT_235724 [Lentinus tigrinus ALCF2SS1-7]
MPFPISFSSFGDIVTAVDLALRISKALSDSTGSSYEYQYLIQELDALAHVLQLADTATRTGMLQPDVVRALISEIGRCRAVMDALWDRTRGYQKALGGSSKSGTGSKTSGSSWRKIGWALFKTQDVQETRAKLATHRANLTTLMTACNLSNIDELKTQCVRFEKTVHSRLSELCNMISQLPYRLSHSEDNAVIFVDWRGIETILPMHLVNHNATQLRGMLDVLSIQWPKYARLWARNYYFWLVCDDTKKVLCDSPSYMGAFGSGTRIRMVGASITAFSLSEFSLSEYSLSECSLSDCVPGQFVCNKCKICAHCRSSRDKTPSFSQFVNSRVDVPTLQIYGCSPESATCMTTLKVMNQKREGFARFVFVYHDMPCKSCPRSRFGIPTQLIPLQADNSEWPVTIPKRQFDSRKTSLH